VISTSKSVTAHSSASGGSSSGHHHARAFSGGLPITVELQARIRFRERNERACFVSTGVSSDRARQILTSVLALPVMENATPELMRVEIHRPDPSKYHNDYSLGVAIAMVSSLIRRGVGEEMLFLGNVDLQDRIQEVDPDRIDRLNDAINRFEIEIPVTIVCCPEAATWVNSSSTVVVRPAHTLAEAVAAAWPGQTLRI
jgi:predicted ATP-dependent serine protease